MAYKIKINCLKFSFIPGFLLSCLFGMAQVGFKPVENWMHDHLEALGGRAVLVVWKDGKIVYDHAENDLSRRQKMISAMIAKRTGKDKSEMQEDFSMKSQQMIASCSKWLSAALVMTFVDEGKLSLNDSIGKFLPVMTAHGKGNILIWQCLSHTTAIKAADLKESLQEMKKISSMDEAVESIANMPMEGEPGKVFRYSNAGLQLAAAVIEKISGKDFETLFQERIAKPCDMTNSDFGHGKVPLPAGSGRSTPKDYIQFLSMILNNGKYDGKKVLGALSVEEMQKNRVTKDCKITGSPAEAGNWGYGFGEWVMDEPLPPSGGESPKRSGAVTSPGLFGSFPWVDNKKQYAGFLFVFNLKNNGRAEMYKELKGLVEQALDSQRP